MRNAAQLFPGIKILKIGIQKSKGCDIEYDLCVVVTVITSDVMSPTIKLGDQVLVRMAACGPGPSNGLP